MYIEHPIAFTNHPLGKADPWPCWDAWILYGGEFPLICFYTFYGGHTLEIANCNNPRDYDDRRVNVITLLPADPDGPRVVIHEDPTDATDRDTIEGELLALHFRLPQLLSEAAVRRSGA